MQRLAAYGLPILRKGQLLSAPIPPPHPPHSLLEPTPQQADSAAAAAKVTEVVFDLARCLTPYIQCCRRRVKFTAIFPAGLSGGSTRFASPQLGPADSTDSAR